MALQLDDDRTQNPMLDAIDTAVGATGSLIVYSGAQPANCSSANPSGELVDITLPSPAFAGASGGAMAKSGTWSASATGTGTAASFRIYNSTGTQDGTTCIMQGSCGIGSGELQFDNTSISSGQTVTVSTFTLTAGNDS